MVIAGSMGGNGYFSVNFRSYYQAGMKGLAISSFFFLSLTSYGQAKTLPDTLTKIKVTSTFFAIPGKTYVDSVEMDMSKTYLDPDNISAIKSYKARGGSIFNRAKRAVLITRKKQIAFVGLSDIFLNSKQLIDTSLRTIFVIDGIVMDTSSVKLEPAVIKSINVLNNATNAALLREVRNNVFILTTNSKKL